MGWDGQKGLALEWLAASSLEPMITRAAGPSRPLSTAGLRQQDVFPSRCALSLQWVHLTPGGKAGQGMYTPVAES